MRWDIKFWAFTDPPEDLSYLLEGGWEPYAVDKHGHYLRRQR